MKNSKLTSLAAAAALTIAALADGPTSANASTTCLGKIATIVGSASGDNLSGIVFFDVVAGLGGKDSVDTGFGGSNVCTGDGNDAVTVGLRINLVSSGAGNERVWATPAQLSFSSSPRRMLPGRWCMWPACHRIGAVR